MGALFAAGLWQFGLPPARMTTQVGAGAAADDVVTTASVRAGRLLITGNNGAPESDGKRLAEQDLLRREFEKRFPDATLAFSTWQFSPETFFARSVAGTLPDTNGVFATEATRLLDLRMSGDVTEEIRTWKLAPYLDMKMFEPVMRGGRIYAMPNGEANGGFYAIMLFYHRDLFREAGLVNEAGEPVPPETWEDLTTMALRLTDRKRGRSGFGFLGENGANAWQFLNFAWQAGGDFERRAADGSWQSVFHEAPVVRALEFLKGLRWRHDVLQRNVLANNDELMQLFTTGRLGMIMLATDQVPVLVDKYGMPFQSIGIAQLPAGPAGRATQIGGAFTLLNPQISGLRKQRAFDSIALKYDLQVTEARLRLLQAQGRSIGLPGIPIFRAEYQDRLDALVNRYRNVPDLSPLMREAARSVRLEPPYAAQSLYANYLGPAVQEVLVDRNARPTEVLKAASRRFQVRELDPVNTRLAGGAGPGGGD